jgi:hypothetical protein
MTHRDGDHFCGVGQAPRASIEHVGKLLEHVVHKRRVDGFLRLEVVVERSEPDVGGLGDFVDGYAFHALFGHQPEGRVEQAGARLALTTGTTRLAFFGNGNRGSWRRTGGTLCCRAIWSVRHDRSSFGHAEV